MANDEMSYQEFWDVAALLALGRIREISDATLRESLDAAKWAASVATHLAGKRADWRMGTKQAPLRDKEPNDAN